MKNIPLAAGGLLDQPYRRTRRNASAYSVYQAFKAYSDFSGTGADFSIHYPGYWDIVTDVEMNIFNGS